jgi:chromosome segregation ATPase
LYDQNVNRLNEELNKFRAKELDTVRVLAEMKQRIATLDAEKQNANSRAEHTESSLKESNAQLRTKLNEWNELSTAKSNLEHERTVLNDRLKKAEDECRRLDTQLRETIELNRREIDKRQELSNRQIHEHALQLSVLTKTVDERERSTRDLEERLRTTTVQLQNAIDTNARQKANHARATARVLSEIGKATSKMREVLAGVRSQTQLSVQDVTHYWNHFVSQWQFKQQERLQAVTQALHREYARRASVERSSHADELKLVEQRARATFEKELTAVRERADAQSARADQNLKHAESLNQKLTDLERQWKEAVAASTKVTEEKKSLEIRIKELTEQITKLEDLRSKLDADRTLISERHTSIASAFGRKKNDFNSTLTILSGVVPAITSSLAKRLVEAEKENDFQSALREFTTIINQFGGYVT